MTHVTITCRRDGEEEVPALRSKDYKDEVEVCADVQGIMEFITRNVR